MKRILKKSALGCLALALGAPLLLCITVCVLALFNGRNPSPTDFSGSEALRNPPPPLAEETTLKVITYNIANAYLFTFNRPERIIGVAEKLMELDPDIVGIQESFIAKDRELLLETLKDSRLQYHAAFPSGTLGSGLLILSAYPIREHWFHRFEANNPWYRLWEGDWWAGKGVGLARVELSDGAIVDFYNLHAQAGRGHATRYLEVRSSQMAGLAQFVEDTRSASGLAFVVGDFNTRMGAADLQIPIDRLKLERLMDMDSRIDHIFGAASPKYRFETLETVEIRGEVQGSGADQFFTRPPTWAEVVHHFTAGPEMTALSDHPGYMSTVRIVPVRGDKE